MDNDYEVDGKWPRRMTRLVGARGLRPRVPGACPFAGVPPALSLRRAIWLSCRAASTLPPLALALSLSFRGDPFDPVSRCTCCSRTVCFLQQGWLDKVCRRSCFPPRNQAFLGVCAHAALLRHMCNAPPLPYGAVDALPPTLFVRFFRFFRAHATLFPSIITLCTSRAV